MTLCSARPTEGKSIFYFSVRSEIVSSSINVRRSKDNAKNLPKLESTSLFFLPVRPNFDSLAEEEEDDPNMAAQTEYKNAR